MTSPRLRERSRCPRNDHDLTLKDAIGTDKRGRDFCFECARERARASLEAKKLTRWGASEPRTPTRDELVRSQRANLEIQSLDDRLARGLVMPWDLPGVKQRIQWLQRQVTV